jgi:hypothetical protein
MTPEQIMTPKEMALEIYNEMSFWLDGREISTISVSSKQCALITINRILSALEEDAGNWIRWNELKAYYEEVKQEIVNLK